MIVSQESILANREAVGRIKEAVNEFPVWMAEHANVFAIDHTFVHSMEELGTEDLEEE